MAVMAVDGMTSQRWCVFPGGSEGNFHNPPLGIFEMRSNCAARVLVLRNTCERSITYCPTDDFESVTEITYECDREVPFACTTRFKRVALFRETFVRRERATV